MLQHKCIQIYNDSQKTGKAYLRFWLSMQIVLFKLGKLILNALIITVPSALVELFFCVDE